MNKTKRRPLRVLLAPVEIAGYYAQLQVGFERLGCDVVRLSLQGDSRHYAQPPAFWPSRQALQLMGAASRNSTKWSGRLLSKCASVTLLVLAIRAILRSDVIVYGFATTITWYPDLELRFARWLGRRIVFVFHGSDSRPPYLGPVVQSHNPGLTVETLRRIVHECHVKVRWCDAYADEVIDNPFSSHFHGRACVNWHVIGIPFANVPPAPAPLPQHDRVRVLHSPSHPETKGTALIREVIGRLRDRGLPIDYVEVIGRSNAEVLNEIAMCNLVVDQAYSDVPMAGLATEAAAYGRPAIVGSLAAEHFPSFIAPADMPPTYLCHPDEMESAIERLVCDRALREQLGSAAFAFVQARRTAVGVAERLMRVLIGDIPPEWRFNPGSVRYGAGCGPPQAARGMISSLVSEYGSSSLELDDWPELRDVVVAEGARSTGPGLPVASGA